MTLQNVPMVDQAMKISRPDSNSPSSVGRSAGLGPAGTSSVSKQPAAASAASDQVELSGLSSYLTSALNGSPAHVGKLSKLAAAISSGQYHVDAHAVSGSLIQHAIEFGGGSNLSLNA